MRRTGNDFFIIVAIFILVLLAVLGPQEKDECAQAVLIDKYISNVKVMVFDVQGEIVEISFSNYHDLLEVYYQNNIGDQVTLCKYKNKIYRFSVGWGVDR